jgi:hypothetical protein
VLFHLSFNAHDPHRTADALARILDATVLDAPSPPFNKGALFICCGDDRGTMISLEPWGVVYEPGPNQMTMMPDAGEAPSRNAFHGLFMAAVPEERILEVAAEQGWPAGRVNQGPFEVINVWVEGHQLLEFTTPELYPAYQATFDAAGVAALDAILRRQEAHLAEVMAGRS